MVPFEPTARSQRGSNLLSGPDAAGTRMLLLEMIGGLGGIARGVTDPLIARERRRSGMEPMGMPPPPQAFAPAPAAPGPMIGNPPEDEAISPEPLAGLAPPARRRNAGFGQALLQVLGLPLG